MMTPDAQVTAEWEGIDPAALELLTIAVRTGHPAYKIEVGRIPGERPRIVVYANPIAAERWRRTFGDTFASLPLDVIGAWALGEAVA